MKKISVNRLHDWNISTAEAVSIQKQLSQKIIIDDQFNDIHLIAGTDVGLHKASGQCFGAVVIMSYPDLQVVARAGTYAEAPFPYIPGLLSFRETPLLIEAFQKLDVVPDMIICDGQGIAHPRRFGLACHLGLLLKLPSIGVAKSRLIGKFNDPGIVKGSYSELLHVNSQIGTVVRTRTGVKPCFVSPGYKVSIASATQIALACCTRYRLPETTREAHRYAAQLTANFQSSYDA